MENEAAQQPQSPAASPVMSRRAREANPFRAMVFGEQADKMIAQGTSVIKLSLGEPDFGAPPAVRDAMREQYDAGPCRTPPPWAYLNCVRPSPTSTASVMTLTSTPSVSA